MTVGELLNEFIKQFQFTYTEDQLEKPADVNDALVLMQIATMLTKAFLTKDDK